MADLRGRWARLRESLWFVPTLIVLTSIGLAVAMVELSGLVTSEIMDRWPRVFGAGAEGARGMLSAIAGSMITVAGVTFSITMVAVTQASTQYSPRILRNFTRDRANQVVLGIFVGIFAYCIVVLRTIRGDEESPFVPSVAVLVGILLALLGIAVLIFFIHHIATTLQASEIIARITRETCGAIDELFPDDLEGATPPEALAAAPPPLTAAWCAVPAGDSGYIQRAGLKRLVKVADEHDLLIRLERMPGDFVVAGQSLAWFAPASGGKPPSGPRESDGRTSGEGDEDPGTVLRGIHTIGSYRTLDHDVRFGIRQLVDIALKALSTGINDTTTAVTCVDYLGAVLLRLANRRIEVLHLGEDRTVRVLGKGPTFEDLLDLAMDEIRRNAGGHVSVLGRQLGVLRWLAAETRSAARLRAVANHVHLIREAAAASVKAEGDRLQLEATAREVLAATGT